MKMFSTIILIILIFLAVSSGITKVTLMQQDVDFFGKYGFLNPILIVYGLVVVFLVGRILYFVGYSKAAEKRSPGAVMSSFTSYILVIGSLIGLVMQSM